MKFLRQLAKVELVAFASLVVAAVAMAIFAAIQTSLHPSPFFNITDSVRVVFLYTLAIGGFYPVSTDGLIKAENSRSRRATLRRMRGLWNRSR